jgi:hypothetical protein
MTLSEQQRLFVKLIASLIDYAYGQGFELTWGEAWRTPQQAHWDAAHGTGIRNSLHVIRLAVDFNLFIGGVYQTDGAAHEPLGRFWETLHPLCRWGGHFGDGNHYSMEWHGRQ